MEINWEDGFEVRTAIEYGTIKVSANRQGLVSLANILLTLANAEPGDHLHLDANNSLEDGSCELILERIDDLQ